MKRLIVFVFIVVLLCGLNIPIVKKTTFKDIFPNAQFEVYTSDKTDCAYDKIANGKGEIIFCDSTQIDDVLHNYKSVMGFTIKISKDALNDDVINLKSSGFGYNNEKYGYSKLFFKSLRVNGREVNYQYKEMDDKILIGSPICLGSY